MLEAPFLRIEVGDRGPALQAPFVPHYPGLKKQCFQQKSLTRTRLARQGDVADVLGRIAHSEYSGM
jgi:hypothetical protein